MGLDAEAQRNRESRDLRSPGFPDADDNSAMMMGCLAAQSHRAEAMGTVCPNRQQTVFAMGS